MTEQELNKHIQVCVKCDCIDEIRRLQESDKRKDEVIAKLKEIIKSMWLSDHETPGNHWDNSDTKREIDNITGHDDKCYHECHECQYRCNCSDIPCSHCKTEGQ